jgi:hypothetical protein
VLHFAFCLAKSGTHFFTVIMRDDRTRRGAAQQEQPQPIGQFISAGATGLAEAQDPGKRLIDFRIGRLTAKKHF